MTQLHRIDPPMFMQSTYPESERAAVRTLSNSISRLPGFVEDFQTAVDVFNFSKGYLSADYLKNYHYRGWPMMAARNGAMTLYHFNQILICSGKSFKDCPKFKGLVDSKALKAARKKFTDAFPNVYGVRHSVGHSAEMGETMANVSENAFTGDLAETNLGTGKVRDLTFHNGLIENRFTTTYEGEIVSYEISEQSTEVLIEVTQDFF